MLIQEEEEEENKRPWRPRRAEQGGWEEGAKDRSALRRFSPLLVKRGYKAQRDGLGESCTRCACSPPPSPSSFSSSLRFLFSSFFPPLGSSCLLPPPPSFSRGMARLFSMRQFNDAMWPRLFAVAGEKSPRGKAEKLARALVETRRGSRQHIGVDFTRSPRIYRTLGKKNAGERLVEIDSASSRPRPRGSPRSSSIFRKDCCGSKRRDDNRDI